MKTENGKIIEATEYELFQVFLEYGYDELIDFEHYKIACVTHGTKIVEKDNESK